METIEFTRIAEKIRESRKYSGLNLETIRNAVMAVSTKTKKVTEIEELARNLLHRVWGAYYSTRPDFNKLFTKYSAGEIKQEDILRIHASTAERLPIATEFYTDISSIIGKVESIADFGCGLHPLLFSQFATVDGISVYDFYDIDQEEIAFLNNVFTHQKLSSFHGYVADLFVDIPPKEYDVAFLFKLLPVLDMIKPHSGLDILRKINAKYIVVSFPTGSLSQNKLKMGDFYRDEFLEKMTKSHFMISQFSYMSEIVFVLQR